MLNFATYLDAHYLVRFLPMYWSVKKHCKAPFLFHVLCLDEHVHVMFQKLRLDSVAIYVLDELLNSDRELAAVRTTRSKVEFYFTCTAAWCLYLLGRHPDLQRVTYVDVDLFFFASPELLFTQYPHDAILVSEHRFDNNCADLCKFGIYNVAFLSFPRTNEALSCLGRWRTQCIEWCYDRLEDGKFADQKYLDEWPGRYTTFRALTHPGANLGPWNIRAVNVVRRWGKVFTGGERLIFYHFESFIEIAKNFVDSGLRAHGPRLAPHVIKMVHCPYVRDVYRAHKVLRVVCGDCKRRSGNTRIDLKICPDQSTTYLMRRVLLGELVLVVLGRAIYLNGRIWRTVVHIVDYFRGNCRID